MVASAGCGDWVIFYHSLLIMHMKAACRKGTGIATHAAICKILHVFCFHALGMDLAELKVHLGLSIVGCIYLFTA